MCFSASASLAAATLMGVAGTYALSRTEDPREWPLASMPLFFAVQQTLEAGLWLTLPQAANAELAVWLARGFLAFALVLWPIYAPVAALLVETDMTRRRLMQVIFGIGVGVAGYFVANIQPEDQLASISGSHIQYAIGATPPLVGALYLVATTAALLVSSKKVILLFGGLVLAGSLTSDLLFEEALISVWCFFAAAGSIVVATYFARERARRLAAESAGRA